MLTIDFAHFLEVGSMPSLALISKVSVFFFFFFRMCLKGKSNNSLHKFYNLYQIDSVVLLPFEVCMHRSVFSMFLKYSTVKNLQRGNTI